MKRGKRMVRKAASTVSKEPKTAGRIKRGEGTLIGNAGEFYVAAELLNRGVIAALESKSRRFVSIEKPSLVADRARSERVRAVQFGALNGIETHRLHSSAEQSRLDCSRPSG